MKTIQEMLAVRTKLKRQIAHTKDPLVKSCLQFNLSLIELKIEKRQALKEFYSPFESYLVCNALGL